MDIDDEPMLCSQQQQQQQQHVLATLSVNKLTPKNAVKNFSKSINPRTPKRSFSQSVMTSNTMMSNSAHNPSSISSLQSPPAKKLQKVKNPFEDALSDRYHLPLIASPSLFQCVEPPQMSSTQCEWTIDEVSSMMPANVEPHETQFSDSPDPEYEAKAQMAISTYFKEQQIVPSPVDCPLRTKRIIISDLSGHTPISKPGRRIRDCASQTELTLPPVLPAALEEALKPYIQTHLAGSNTKEFKKSRYIPKAFNSPGSNSNVKDTSLRRKLFDIHNVFIWDNDRPPQHRGTASSSADHTNSSPISMQHTAIVGKLSDSSDKSSFGSLSPISATDDLSPDVDEGSAGKRQRFAYLRNRLEDLEQFSPIHAPVKTNFMEKENTKLYRSQKKENLSIDLLNDITHDEEEIFSPERSSSPLAAVSTRNIAEYSTESLHVKVSRLKVKSSEMKQRLEEIIKQSENLEDNAFLMCHEQMPEESSQDSEEMQVSQVSVLSSNGGSPSLSDTPRGNRRSATRKNLSLSFWANWLNDCEDMDEEEPKAAVVRSSLKLEKETAIKKLNSKVVVSTPAAAAAVEAAKCSNSFAGIVHHNTPLHETSARKSLTFYRTDSGFNEMSQNSSGSQDCPNSQQATTEPHMCCSTPSKKDDKFDFIN